jgi:hypothetical protein
MSLKFLIGGGISSPSTMMCHCARATSNATCSLHGSRHASRRRAAHVRKALSQKRTPAVGAAASAALVRSLYIATPCGGSRRTRPRPSNGCAPAAASCTWERTTSHSGTQPVAPVAWPAAQRSAANAHGAVGIRACACTGRRGGQRCATPRSPRAGWGARVRMRMKRTVEERAKCSGRQCVSVRGCGPRVRADPVFIDSWYITPLASSPTDISGLRSSSSSTMCTCRAGSALQVAACMACTGCGTLRVVCCMLYAVVQRLHDSRASAHHRYAACCGSCCLPTRRALSLSVAAVLASATCYSLQ